MLENFSKSFSEIPSWVLDELSKGRPSIENAQEMIEDLKNTQKDGSVYLEDGVEATDNEIWYTPQLLEGMLGDSE